MKIVLESTYGDQNFKGTNESGQSIQLSGSKQAVGPMESVLMASAGCSAIDVDLILRKMRQEFTDIRVEVDAQRAEGQTPSVFTHIHLKYIIYGTDLKQDKVDKAVEMSVKTYCSVLTMLEKSVIIAYSNEIRSGKP